MGRGWAEGQVNPRREHVLETLKWRNREETARMMRSRPGVYLAGTPSVSVVCDRAPTLARAGKFTVTVANDDGSD